MYSLITIMTIQEKLWSSARGRHIAGILFRALSRQISIDNFRRRIRPSALVIREQKQWSSSPPWCASRQYRIYSDNVLQPACLVACSSSFLVCSEELQGEIIRRFWRYGWRRKAVAIAGSTEKRSESASQFVAPSHVRRRRPIAPGCSPGPRSNPKVGGPLAEASFIS
jgi:hypothetical protein